MAGAPGGPLAGLQSSVASVLPAPKPQGGGGGMNRNLNPAQFGKLGGGGGAAAGGEAAAAGGEAAGGAAAGGLAELAPLALLA